MFSMQNLNQSILIHNQVRVWQHDTLNIFLHICLSRVPSTASRIIPLIELDTAPQQGLLKAREVLQPDQER